MDGAACLYCIPQLASNILARLAGAPTKPFLFRPKGQLSSIGHNKAVAEVFGLRLSGFERVFAERP